MMTARGKPEPGAGSRKQARKGQKAATTRRPLARKGSPRCGSIPRGARTPVSMVLAGLPEEGKMNDFVTTANRIRKYVTAAVTGLMVYALWVSMTHITYVATWAGIPGAEAKTAFILVDLVALIGKVFQLKYFAASTRKHGRQMTYVSGSISLACNVFAGILHGSVGAAVWGAFVVGMFLYLESKIAKIKPAAAVTRAKNAESETEISKAPAKVPAAVGPRGGKVWTPERRAAFEARKAMKDLEKAYAGPAAPVSPAS